jgi:hypothetical protein
MHKKKTTTYEITPSGQLVIDSKKPVVGICGPVGSGKSTASMLALIKRASEQPLYNGVRRARVCLIRSTVPELRTTTIVTFLHIFPETKMKYNFPINGLLEFVNDAGEPVSIEILFLPVATKEDTKRLRSLEITLAYINEANQVPQGVISACQDRVGRYPAKTHGGCSDSGIILDTNAFTSDHWLRQFFYKNFKVETPNNGDAQETSTMLLVRQPPAVFQFSSKDACLNSIDKIDDDIKEKIKPHTIEPVKSINGFWFHVNPYSDNLDNLPKNYYTRSVEVKTAQDVNVNYMSHFKSDSYSDTACYPMFNTELHITDKLPDLDNAQYLILGWDFGLTPACSAYAVYPTDEGPKIVVFAEIFKENMGLERFIPYVKTKLAEFGLSGSNDTVSFMDVAGQQRAQSNESTCLSVLQRHGFITGGTVTQNIVSRLEAVRNFLYRKDAFLIHRDCEMLISGLMGEYKFSENTAEKGILKPDKNKYSHLADTMQYAALGINTIYESSTTALDDF